MEQKKLSVSAKSFAASMLIIVLLMLAAYALSLVLPTGEYIRTVDANGNSVIDTSLDEKGTFVAKEASFPFRKLLLSPVLVLGSTGSATLIMILIFLLVIGGIFQALTDRGMIEYFLRVMIDRFYGQRRLLLLLLPLFFMFLATVAGVFEEIIPLVPILCALAVSLGWDAFTGLVFSIIPCACGYAAGVFNPFGTGVAQKVAGVPVFGGVWMRLVVFAVLYAALAVFLLLYTGRYERQHPVKTGAARETFSPDPRLGKGLAFFGITLGIGVVLIVSSVFLTALQDFTLVIFALCFLIGGGIGCALSGMAVKKFFRSFAAGMAAMLPALVMILFASSIRYILTESLTLDALVHFFITAADGIPRSVLILFVYLVVLVVELFVPSGSAKAFLLIPLLLPIGTIYALPVNLIVLAYIFGDGLANVIYPTNPGLLIALNLAGTDYPAYMRRAWKLFLALFLLTCLLLLFALAVNYT